MLKILSIYCFNLAHCDKTIESEKQKERIRPHSLSVDDLHLCCSHATLHVKNKYADHPLVREPAIGLIKWLRPKGLKVCTYVEKCAEFKN